MHALVVEICVVLRISVVSEIRFLHAENVNVKVRTKINRKYNKKLKL